MLLNRRMHCASPKSKPSNGWRFQIWLQTEFQAPMEMTNLPFLCLKHLKLRRLLTKEETRKIDPFSGINHHWACCHWANPLPHTQYYHFKSIYWVLPVDWAHPWGYGDEQAPAPDLKSSQFAAQGRCMSQTYTPAEAPQRCMSIVQGGADKKFTSLTTLSSFQ